MRVRILLYKEALPSPLLPSSSMMMAKRRAAKDAKAANTAKISRLITYYSFTSEDTLNLL